MALKWVEYPGQRYVGAACGPYTVKVFETMLGHAVYQVTRGDRQVGAGVESSVEQAKAVVEAMVLGFC